MKREEVLKRIAFLEEEANRLYFRAEKSLTDLEDYVEGVHQEYKTLHAQVEDLRREAAQYRRELDEQPY